MYIHWDPGHRALLPSKVLPSHLIEALVMWPVEVPQHLHHLRVNVCVRPSLRLAQAVGFTAALWLLQAGEALGLVEVEMLVGDDPLQAQEVLDLAQLSRRIGDEPLAADQMDLSPGEPQEPALQVLGVQANPQRAPQGVDLTCGGETHQVLCTFMISVMLSLASKMSFHQCLSAGGV